MFNSQSGEGFHVTFDPVKAGRCTRFEHGRTQGCPKVDPKLTSG